VIWTTAWPIYREGVNLPTIQQSFGSFQNLSIEALSIDEKEVDVNVSMLSPIRMVMSNRSLHERFPS
jgi:hypothetical protein